MTSSPALNGSLTHEPDRFSDAAWDLLLSGQDVARRWRHEQLDVCLLYTSDAADE